MGTQRLVEWKKIMTHHIAQKENPKRIDPVQADCATEPP